ncbi:hypothetical protein PMIN03_006553 [Paraphaeosphaeria minitans]
MMPPTASASGSRSPQATGTPERGEPESKIIRPLNPDNRIGLSARPPTILKLKLRNTPAEPNAPRRSDRVVTKTAKQGKDLSGSGALVPQAKPPKRLLPVKFSASRRLGTPPPPHEFARRVAGHADGRLPSNAGGSIPTERRGDSLLQIKPGNINDPIDVDSLPSPPPHLWVNRPANYYAPFPLHYRPSRPHVSPTLFAPTETEKHSGKVSSHQSHDIYRNYIDLRDAPAPPGFAISCAKLSAEVSASTPNSGGSIPFPHMHSADMNGYGHAHGGIVGLPYASSLHSRYQSYPHDYRAHTNSYYTPLHGCPIFPVLDEEHLRHRAVQFVLDHSRPRTRKRRLSDDPDETSGSENEDAHGQSKKKSKISPLTERPTNLSQPSDETMVSTPSTGKSKDNMFDRNLKLAELVEHTQLLTAMLMTYPRSQDQKSMREDIAMLATVNDQRLASWEAAEIEFDRDTRQRLTSAATPSPSMHGLSKATLDEGKKAAGQVGAEGGIKKRPEEDELRKYLSASSAVWDNIGRETIGEKDGVSGAKESGEDIAGSLLGAYETVACMQDAVLPLAAA